MMPKYLVKAVVITVSALGMLLHSSPAVLAQARCLGREATIVGTKGDDKIRGTSGNDVIVGNGGEDVIRGLGGRDRICAEGRSRISGGANDDKLRLRGDGMVRGGAGRDIIAGGGRLFGGSGDDRIEARMDLGPLTSLLSGGAGDDHLSGETGFKAGFAFYHSVTYAHAPRSVRVNLERGRASGWGRDVLKDIAHVVGSDFDDVIVGTSTTDPDIPADYHAINSLRGGRGDDALYGKKSADSLAGGQGDDRLFGGRGDDRLDGGRGSDEVRGGRHSRGRALPHGDTASYARATRAVKIDLRDGSGRGLGSDSLSGIETVEGSAFPDKLLGGEKNDSLEGRGGNDRLLGRGGSDALNGGRHDDQLIGGRGADSLTPGTGDDSVDGGLGPGDLVAYFLSDTGVTVDLAEGSAIGQGSDELAGIEDVMGSTEDDALFGDAGPNRIIALAGADEVHGRDGADDLRGWGDNDSLFGESGDDRIFGSFGDDLLDGGDGSDHLHGGDGTDLCINGETTTKCE